MTKRWKLKTNSSNILLVLITLILVKAEWIKEESNSIWEGTNAIESHENQISDVLTYVGNDEIAEYFFNSSLSNNSLILDGINKCLNSFQLITCVKMLLLSKVNEVLSFMSDPNISQRNVTFLNGILVFEIKNKTNTTGFSENNDSLSLNEEITVKVKKIFQNRSLLVNLMPKVKIEIEPSSGQHGNDFVCFTYRLRKESESENSRNAHEDILNEGRKKKGGGMSMMMMVPQLIMLGLMPFTLASLKAMVMNAVMINMMALNGAIFMTIRNLVFGPRQGDNVKYVNYGYSKNRQTQSPKPVLIIHSPAAFVKQPPVYKKQVHGTSLHRNKFTYSPQHHSYHNINSENIKEEYYYTQNNRRRIEKDNDTGWMSAYEKGIKDTRIQNEDIYQRQLKQVKDRQRNTSFTGETLEGNSFKGGVNFDYSSVDIKDRNSPEKSFSEHIEYQKKKINFKPSPQWNSGVFNTRTTTVSK